MAEVVRWRTETRTETVYRNRPGQAAVKITERVRVSSILSDRMGVSVLEDLVHALQAAGVTRGQVTAHRSSVGHLTQLVVESEVPQPVPDDVPPVDDPAAEGPPAAAGDDPEGAAA